ncbi:hypothetical protein EVAR_35194_1 [Eumeta japonica]|uniref:Uncharacterized protein n=1 Tax=Eumeta variegata TaxID=151549 RepID=A0A4C1VCN2_EUMVA|nr:hypothetical protein EVAR_35194_1 [Eumeta japonica]
MIQSAHAVTALGTPRRGRAGADLRSSARILEEHACVPNLQHSDTNRTVLWTTALNGSRTQVFQKYNMCEEVYRSEGAQVLRGGRLGRRRGGARRGVRGAGHRCLRVRRRPPDVLAPLASVGDGRTGDRVMHQKVGSLNGPLAHLARLDINTDIGQSDVYS